jgi:2-amino-4-hydroxy-6-hydroxymethyldihydropteridine diphosphokinase
MPNTAYLFLGSNIEPEKNMVAAIKLLAEMTRLVTVSPVWESKPIGFTNQPNFLNAAAIVETNLDAEQLVESVAHTIEKRLGRRRQLNKNAPRTIDIDLILFNHQIFESNYHHIPSPELLGRPFVAIPLAAIAPNVRHPETGQTLQDIAESFDVAPDDIQLRPNISETVMALGMSTEKAREK